MRSFCLFVACLVIVCGAAVYVGAVPTHRFGHDIFFFLDNGWRVVNGQRPHLDFTSAWGPLSFFIAAFGLFLSHYSVDGIGYGNAAFALIISLWGYRLSRGAMPSLPRLFVCLYLALLVVSPYPLGWGVFSSSYAMLYNRYGYALLGLLMLETASARARMEIGVAKDDAFGGFSVGVLSALTLFLKANFFAGALLILMLSPCVARPSARRIAATAAGFALTSLLFLAYLDFNIAAIYHDLQMAAGARGAGFTSRELSFKLLLNLPSLLFILFLCALSGRAGGQARYVAAASAGICVFAIDMLLLVSNQQYRELPLTALLASFMAVDAYRGGREGSRHRTALSRSVVVAGTAYFAVSFGSQAVGLGYAVEQKRRPADIGNVTKFISEPLHPLYLYDEPNEPASNGSRYVAYVNSGVSLLQRYAGTGDTVLTMDMMNPFSYALRRPSPRGGMAAAAYKCTLSDAYRPSGSRFFGNADIVMVPKQPALRPVMFDQLMAAYAIPLHERYRLAAETDMWFLYRRKSASLATSFQGGAD
ncbi:hypothetical protein [Geomonas edaphica]|uniref:hypothetical protein n=1 Tax=Geomonas edaphica TaxID=2570226 RepID=UPI0010A943B7|nr:hypothetical protein [Geomonas edaphica]